ncbi:TPM domain-containing protein [Rhodobacteraceae bacterium D3-12]|nr:TPM domain-containing protein [Rhodobacteraceae bacterium D3-12]
MKRILFSWLALALLFTGPIAAQTYPDPSATTVNDFANLLPPESEAELVAQLEALQKDTGVVMTVVTLSRKDMFAPDQSVEAFSKGLFEQWKIGNAEKNDGVLFLVLHTDREMRIELGEAYGYDWQVATQIVLNRSVIPAFKEERYNDGIRAGVTDTIDLIITNHIAGQDAPKPDASGAASDTLPPAGGAADGQPKDGEESGGLGAWWAAIIFAPFAALIGWGALKSKLAKCPKCGNRGLKVSHSHLQEPTETKPGRGETVTECENCGHREVKEYTIAARGKDDEPPKPDMGGGKSGGGGATGKW